ncbi:hypothetical protein L1887_40005 [Cichorium endivia]|nr:hypothetical protein L1887_40005 [Cichorium endivia]
MQSLLIEIPLPACPHDPNAKSNTHQKSNRREADFGMLLTGKQSTDLSDFVDNNLADWVKQHRKTKISDVFDRELLREDPGLEIKLLHHLRVAVGCLDDP